MGSYIPPEPSALTKSSDNHDEQEETHYYKAESNTILKHDKKIKLDPPVLSWPFDTKHSCHGTSDHKRRYEEASRVSRCTRFITLHNPRYQVNAHEHKKSKTITKHTKIVDP